VSDRSEIAIEGIIRADESLSRKFGHDPGRAVYDCGPDEMDKERKGPADLEHEMAEAGSRRGGKPASSPLKNWDPQRAVFTRKGFFEIVLL
jgi:hypothetical protein